MLSKCANPGCTNPFRYLRDGKLFEFQRTEEQTPESQSKKPVRRVEFFWLCGQCSTELTVVRDEKKGVITMPLPPSKPYLVKRAAAS